MPSEKKRKINACPDSVLEWVRSRGCQALRFLLGHTASTGQEQGGGQGRAHWRNGSSRAHGQWWRTAVPRALRTHCPVSPPPIGAEPPLQGAPVSKVALPRVTYRNTHRAAAKRVGVGCFHPAHEHSTQATAGVMHNLGSAWVEPSKRKATQQAGSSSSQALLVGIQKSLKP